MKLRKVGCYLGLIFGGCLLSATAVQAQAQQAWHLEKDKDQIQVYSRHVPGSRSNELKVECTMNGTQSQLVALLSDIANYKNVIYKTKSSELIRRVSETELLYHVVTAVPWPVSDRDMSVQLTFEQDPVTKLLQVRGVGVPNLVAVQPGTVRIVDWLAIWLVRPISKQQMQVTYTCRIDPGGDIPPWLDNIAASMSAYQSFALIRKSIALPRYQGKSFAFLAP
ncbi:START domain-containing protein [Spirosoma flavum]|uniref:START domain-containing protein n=1 Tax=Spirosoma flavum TaxID=2048557 RepID=A0ABW6AL37_9BACT